MDLPVCPDRMVEDLFLVCRDQWGEGGLVQVFQENGRVGAWARGHQVCQADLVHPHLFQNNIWS